MGVQGGRPPDGGAVREGAHDDLLGDGILVNQPGKLKVTGVKRDEGDTSREEGGEDGRGQDGREDPRRKSADRRRWDSGATVTVGACVALRLYWHWEPENHSGQMQLPLP